MAMPAQLARAMHPLVELTYAVAFFAPETRDAWERLGLEPVAQGYVAGRAAPLGAVGPGTVAACFFNFNPALVRMAVPAAWEIATPAQILAARTEAMQACFERLEVPTDDVAEVTELAQQAMDGVFLGGRPLAAANAEVPLVGQPLGDLWQALGVLREYRGDAHVALLTAAGVGPVEAIQLYAGWQDAVSRRFLQMTRMWDDDAWAAGEAGLRERAWADDQGLTNAGMAFREDLEDRTDQAAAAPWATLGEDRTRRLWELLRPIAEAAAAGYPKPPTIPDTMGV